MKQPCAKLTGVCMTKEYEDEYDHIYCYGVAFYKKRCLVKQKKEN